MNKRGIGFKYENLAKNYLINKGLEYIESNYYTEYGEIDLIFKDKNKTLLFIEVKYRRTPKYGLAEESVTNKKLTRVINSSLDYISKKDWTGSYRYDLIAINGEKIIWIKNLV